MPQASLHFAVVFLSHLVQQWLSRVVTLLDLFLLSSWSPLRVAVDLEEPLQILLDWSIALRVVLLQIVISFKKSCGIWPDLLLVLVAGGSIIFAYNCVFGWEYFIGYSCVVLLEFVCVFWSADRRRQRKLWAHNASFRLAAFRPRNPFQRSVRRSLLLPLIRKTKKDTQHVPVEPAASSTHPDTFHVNESSLVSGFIDYVPFTSGHRAEQRTLHVHYLFAGSDLCASSIIFFHQFGGGAFTWQPVMDVLSRTHPSYQLLAVDRFGHGLTFGSNRGESREDDSTPVSEDLSKVVHFKDTVNNDGFETTVVDHVRAAVGVAGRKVILVAAGGAGAAEAIEYSLAHKNEVRGIIFISPYWMRTRGVPSILKSMAASASVGRALLLSMAKSEVTDLLPRRAWGHRVVPESLLAAYRHCVDVPGWEEDILQVLARDTNVEGMDVTVPVLLLAGDLDHLTENPAEYAQFICGFPDHESKVLRECGAAAQEEQPDAVAAEIVRFVEKKDQ